MNQLFNSPFIPRYIGHYFSVDIDTLKNFCKDIDSQYNNFYVVEDNLIDFSFGDTRNYLKSKGSDKTKINPTKRSKLIFGFASLMKKISQKRIVFLNMRNELIQLDENYEPYITDFSSAKFSVDESNEDINPYYLYCSPKWTEDLIPLRFPSSNVYSFAIFLYLMFNHESDFILNDQKGRINSPAKYEIRIARGARPVRPKSIPDHYWDLIEHCWCQDPNERLSFDSIVEILKDDKFALTEFGVETNLTELHEYQNRIENAVTNEESKASLIREINELKAKIKKRPQESSSDILKLNILDSDMIHNLRKIREISSGGGGKVLEVGKEEKYALKMMHTGDISIENFKGFIAEYEKLVKLKHPNIVDAYGIFMSDATTPPSILLE